jgi:hypothetical protein
MNEKVNIHSENRCILCNKVYSSRSSLCNHNKKFHNTISKQKVNISKHTGQQKVNISKHEDIILNTDVKSCKYCNKIFSCKQSRWRHEKTCKSINNCTKINQLEETINELKNQVSLILKEKGKIHHKTLQKINNQLNNINNGKIINNTYVKFGDMEYEKVLNNKQIKHILNQQYQSLEESIKQIHFNEELPEYSNIFITNMKDDLGYVFNGKQFISIRKNEMINELIDVHTKEINLSLEKNKNKLNEKYVTRLEKFLDMLNDDDTSFIDNDNKRTYSSYKAYKMNSIKLLIYNNSDKKKLETLNNIELKEKIDDSEELLSLIE